MIYKNIKCISYICSTANLEKKVIRSKLFKLNCVKIHNVHAHNDSVT